MSLVPRSRFTRAGVLVAAVVLGLGFGLPLGLGCHGMDAPRFGDHKPLVEYELPEGQHAQGVGFAQGEVIVTALRSDQPTGKGYLHFFDAKTGKLLRTVLQPSLVAHFGFFAEGKKLLTARADGGGFHVFSGKDWELAETFPEGPAGPERGPLIRQFKVLPDGKRAAVADVGNDGAKLWDLDTKKVVARFPAPGKHPGTDIDINVESVDVSPDGKQLAVALGAPRLELYDIETQKLKATLAVETGIHTCVLYSPNGKWIAAGHLNKSGEKQVLLWDTAGQKLRHTCECEGLAFPPRILAFTSDSKYVLACAGGFQKQPGCFVVWSTESGKAVATFEAEIGSRFALSPDGKSLLTVGGKGVHKWDFAAIRKEFEAKEEKDKK